jgi:MscS family membrane protein
MDAKVSLLRAQLLVAKTDLKKLDKNDPGYSMLKDEIDRHEGSIPRLLLEGRLNKELEGLVEALRTLIRGIRAREVKGLSEMERQEIFCNFIAPVEAKATLVNQLSTEWSQSSDPWLRDRDQWDMRDLWETRNEQLAQRWEKVKKSIDHPDDRSEMRLDDITRDLIDWIKMEYKLVPEYWKDPTVLVKGFTNANPQIKVSYYVDNIRLEHDERAARVRSQIAHRIWNYLTAAGVWR